MVTFHNCLLTVTWNEIYTDIKEIFLRIHIIYLYKLKNLDIFYELLKIFYYRIDWLLLNVKNYDLIINKYTHLYLLIFSKLKCINERIAKSFLSSWQVEIVVMKKNVNKYNKLYNLYIVL